MKVVKLTKNITCQFTVCAIAAIVQLVFTSNVGSEVRDNWIRRNYAEVK